MHKYSLFMCKIPSISDIFKVNHSCDTEINLSKYCLQPSASTEGCAAYRCICTPVLVYVWQLQDKLHCLIFRCPIKEFKRNSTQILKRHPALCYTQVFRKSMAAVFLQAFIKIENKKSFIQTIVQGVKE